MAGEYSGITKVEIDTAGNSFAGATDLGVPLTEGGDAPELPEVMNAKGQGLYAGKNYAGSFEFTDLSNYSALETIMKADTAQDIRVTQSDGTVSTIALDVLIKVKKMFKTGTGERNTFELKWSGFDT